MSAEPQRRLTAEEYLAFERESEIRHEYLDGELFAMAGASREHNLIGTNLVAALHAQVRKQGCELYANGMRVRVPATGLYTYPDLIAICGRPRFDDAESDTLLNPDLIVEILPTSTEDYDRGRKFAHYRSIPSLQIYLLVSQEKAHAEVFTRQRDGRWILWETDDLDATVELPVVGAAVGMREIYDRVPGLSGE